MNALTRTDEATAVRLETRSYIELLDDRHRGILADARQRIADTRRWERDELKSIREARKEALAEFDRREAETRARAETDVSDDQTIALKMEAALCVAPSPAALPAKRRGK